MKSWQFGVKAHQEPENHLCNYYLQVHEHRDDNSLFCQRNRELRCQPVNTTTHTYCVGTRIAITYLKKRGIKMILKRKEERQRQKRLPKLQRMRKEEWILHQEDKRHPVGNEVHSGEVQKKVGNCETREEN